MLARACRTLEVLQDRVEPRPFPEVELAIEQELGRPIAELFAEFEPEARAAASLAQVMLQAIVCCTFLVRASLRGGGKLRRTGIASVYGLS